MADEYIKEKYDHAYKTLKEIANNPNCVCISLAQATIDILDDWENLFERDKKKVIQQRDIAVETLMDIRVKLLSGVPFGQKGKLIDDVNDLIAERLAQIRKGTE